MSMNGFNNLEVLEITLTEIIITGGLLKKGNQIIDGVFLMKTVMPGNMMSKQMPITFIIFLRNNLI